MKNAPGKYTRRISTRGAHGPHESPFFNVLLFSLFRMVLFRMVLPNVFQLPDARNSEMPHF